MKNCMESNYDIEGFILMPEFICESVINCFFHEKIKFYKNSVRRWGKGVLSFRDLTSLWHGKASLQGEISKRENYLQKITLLQNVRETECHP